MLPIRRTAWKQIGWTCKSCCGLNDPFLLPKRHLHATRYLRREKFAAWKEEYGKLPNTPARTRFAPSPTGDLHLGSLRTALYNYLLAKATGGQFLLRIEDTDSKRTVPGAEERLCQDLEWAGLQWDEGTVSPTPWCSQLTESGPKVGGPYGPYIQSERIALYKQHADKLLANHHAYRCFCSPERLDTLARERSALGLATHYDRICLGISQDEANERGSKGEAHVIRLKAPTEYPEYNDLVYGKVGSEKLQRKGQNYFEDTILVKSDGWPTYHLANVVDDHHMKITHVIRGVEWMPSTPKHLELYRVFGWEPPAFAHVALLQDSSRQKLSKRNLATNLEVLKSNGVLPEALLNYIALLGWSHSLGSDFMTKQQLIDNFSLKFTRGLGVLNPPKLDHLSAQHFRRHVEKGGGEDFEKIVDQFLVLVEQGTGTSTNLDYLDGRTMREFVVAFLRAGFTGRYSSAKAYFESYKSVFGINQGSSSTTQAFLKERPLSGISEVADAARDLANIPESQWSLETLKERLSMIAESLTQGKDGILDDADRLQDPKYAYATLLAWIRWALVRVHWGPSIIHIMSLYGRRVTLQRLEASAASIT
ncbi:Glutamate--tRNA ligase mitochondrial [Trapelia coarctata]|nr:Glutamate--tRNA ligase mitochondrial [Trapelia coarctata]